jgi:hypothetical protein
MTRDENLHPDLRRDPSLPAWPDPIPIEIARRCRRGDDRIALALFVLSKCAYRHEPQALDQALRALGLRASRRTAIAAVVAKACRGE